MDSKVFAFIFFFGAVITSCNPTESTPTEDPSSGRALAEQYCQGCHLFPEPDRLPKEVWESYILPRMGYVYGIYPDDTTRESLFEPNYGGELVEQAGIFPEKRVLDEETWQAIRDYYLTAAPEQLSVTSKDTISTELAQFSPRFPDLYLSPPSSTLVQFGPNGTIYLGDANKQGLLILDKTLNVAAQARLKEGPVALREFTDQFWITVMGSFSPTDNPSGFISVLSKQQGAAAIPIDSLRRPVYADYGDLDQDNQLDVVVCEFGKWTGSLSWYRNQGDGTFEKKVLLPVPGAIKAYIQDMNADSLPDIVALFGQSDEGIDIFYNQGEGKFERERVLRFPPTHGSSFMALQDLNGDAHLDIVYTAGDNADYNPILKPYHGIYFYLNDGNNQFKRSFFYPLNGAYGAEVQDFDGDGDLDIAAISFFPDYVSQAKEGFIYLENKGDFQIKSPQTFAGADKGRWLTMDMADYDQDGDQDLILGSLTFEVVPKLGYVEQWVQQGLPFVVLENQHRK